MNKRAISQLVTTILIILLVLAAIIIFWQAAKRITEKGAETITEKTKCLSIDLSLENIVCDISEDGVSGSVKRGADDIEGITMKIVVGNNVHDKDAPEPLGSVQFTKLDDDPALSSNDEVLIKVAPVIGEFICAPIDQVTIICEA